MAHYTPESNMALLANGAELTHVVVSSMMSNAAVREFFGKSAARSVVYEAFNMAVFNKLSGILNQRPSGQFDKAVMLGRHKAMAVRHVTKGA